MTVVSEHSEETLSQKEWEEKLLVVREGRRDQGVAWPGWGEPGGLYLPRVVTPALI